MTWGGQRALARSRRDDLSAVIQAFLAIRWLALGVLIALGAMTPASTPIRPAILLYGGVLLYSIAFTVYLWRYPGQEESAARGILACDAAVVLVGMHIMPFPREFLFLGSVVAVLVGLLWGRSGATVVAGALALAQNPAAHASIFAPNHWLAWFLTAMSLLAVGNVGAAAAERLSDRARLAHTLTEISRTVAAAAPITDAAAAVLGAAAAYFRADTGSLMLFDPRTEYLEILAARGLADAYRQVRPRLGEGIAGWVAQGERAILLSPGSTVPFRLERPEIRSAMCVPILVARELLGVLNLNRTTTDRLFSQGDLDTAETLAHHLAALLWRAQQERTLPVLIGTLADGHSKVSSALSRDPVVLWPALLDLVRSITAAQFGVLAIEREDTGNLEVVGARGIDGTSARDLIPALLAATTHGTIHVAEGTRDGRVHAPLVSVTCVPLFMRSRAIGALALGLPEGGAYPHSLLEAVAAYVAAAVGTALTARRVADIGAVEERRRIAREMHDGLAQTLADALLQTDLAAVTAQSDRAQAASEMKGLRALLERAMRELRQFMAELRRDDAAERRLFPALDALAREFDSRYHLQVTVVATGDDTNLPPAVWHAVLAITRHALVNVQAHAQAACVILRAEATDERCTVSITDDGAGFDVGAYRALGHASHHLGLTSMEERAALVGGRLQVESAPNHGTTVMIHIPLGGDHG